MRHVASCCASALNDAVGCRWGSGLGAQWRGGRGPAHSINFITAHDGFSLADLVAYNDKHNEANGEMNRCTSICCVAS